MNLLDIRTKTWSNSCIEALTGVTDSDLANKLGTPVPTETVQGVISQYFVERFGFSPECRILSFTGDNPSSFAGEFYFYYYILLRVKNTVTNYNSCSNSISCVYRNVLRLE